VAGLIEQHRKSLEIVVLFAEEADSEDQAHERAQAPGRVARLEARASADAS
jgi:hypothetical protein